MKVRVSHKCGNYTLQFNCRVENTTNFPLTPSLFVIAVNSGFLETQMGSSRIIRGVLTEQDVISARPAPVSVRGDLERMVGGGFLSKLGTALNTAKGLLSRPEVREAAKGIARATGHKGIADAAESLGFGVAGAGRTGGRKAKHANLHALM